MSVSAETFVTFSFPRKALFELLTIIVLYTNLINKCVVFDMGIAGKVMYYQNGNFYNYFP